MIMSVNRGRGRGRGRGLYIQQQELNIAPGITPIQNPSDQSKINAEMNRITINLDLDLPSEQWFTQFKNSWNLYKKGPTVTSMLYQHLDSVENPYEQALRLMYNCLDFKYAKTKSLAYIIMEDFKIWSSISRNKIIHLLTTDIKVSAFNIVRQQSQWALMKLVAETYELTTDCKILQNIFLDIIRLLIQEKQFKEACQCSVLLGLQEKFGIHEFLVPLVLQDKLFFVEDFLLSHKQHQIDLVSYLDSIVGQRISIRSALESYIVDNQIPEVKPEKLCYKPWRKLITRLMKMYKLPPDVSPNLNKKRNEGALQFLLNKRFVENSFGYESWKEMIQEAVKDDPNLQQELVAQIAVFGDTSEALMWAHFYNIPREYWPHSVRLFDENPNNDRHQQENSRVEPEDVWDYSQTAQATNFHKLALPIDRIILIDSVQEFQHFLEHIRNVCLVGVDCEWKPTFGVQKSELALIQIATRDCVYILDVITLAREDSQLWQQLGKSLFNNCDILKLGFSFTSDISIIIHSLPHLSFNKHAGFLDLLSLWKQIDKSQKVELPHEVQSSGLSLSTLVHSCLGNPLDKKDQFSNWEKRPLRQSQLEYAALDAYCLIEVYDILKLRSEAVNFPFDETCYHLMNTTKFKKKKSKPHLLKSKGKDTPKINPQPPSPHFEPIPADKIAFVCDTMLQGLGKSLRRIGIDTAILENNADHKECVRSYQDERRYILTRGQAFNMLMGYAPAGHCFHLESDDIDEQLKQVVEYFNISVTKDHVFSRCQGCNSNSFVKIAKSTMHLLAVEDKKDKQMRINNIDLADEATGFSSDDDYEDHPGPPPSYNRKWETCTEEKVDLGLCMTRNGARIQVDDVPVGVLEKHDLFYVCEDCGKVYWDGSHFEKVLANRLQGIIL